MLGEVDAGQKDRWTEGACQLRQQANTLPEFRRNSKLPEGQPSAQVAKLPEGQPSAQVANDFADRGGERNSHHDCHLHRHRIGRSNLLRVAPLGVVHSLSGPLQSRVVPAGVRSNRDKPRLDRRRLLETQQLRFRLPAMPNEARR